MRSSYQRIFGIFAWRQSRAIVSSMGGLERPKHAVPKLSLNGAIAGLPLALIAAGPAIVTGVGGRTLPVYASQIAIAVLLIHIGFSALAHRSYGVPNMMRWLLAAIALLALPLMWSNDPAAAMLAYVNFASGTVGGMAIAAVWKGMPRSYSWIDVGYIVFLIVAVAQLLVTYSQARSVNALHQSSQTPWGNSNFVAGCIVVAALIVMGRSASLGRGRKFAVTVGLVAIGVALLTLSRGALIAACVGAVFLLWSKSQAQRTAAGQVHVNAVVARLLSRTLAVFVPAVAFLAVGHVTELRAQVSGQVYRNVDTRFEMYRMAWQQFLESPLTGTGWASFREVSSLGSSFAHNLVLSMLQIGGLLAVPYLTTLGVLAYRVFRRGGPYAAAVAAAIAISMTDPFFESTVGNLIVLPVAFLACLSPARTADHDGKATPRTGSARTGLRPGGRMQHV